MQLEIDLSALRGPDALRVVTARIVATHFRNLIEAATRLIEEENSALPREKPDHIPGKGD
jgi:hypothetical protein